MSTDDLDMSLDDIISRESGNKGGGGSSRPSRKKREGKNDHQDRHSAPKQSNSGRAGKTARENRESKPSTRAPKDDTCFGFRDTGTCVHGDDCRFRHGDNDSRDRKSGRDSAPKKFNVGTRVYVGNLSWQTSWQDLKDFFRSSGTVVYADVMKRSDGKSQGCGIVEFSSNEEALDAITNLNDAELDGRMIFIREDREDYKVNNKPTTRTFVARPRSSESRRDDRRDDRRSYDGHDDRRDDRGSSRRDNRDNDNDNSWGRSNRKDRNTNTNNSDTDSLTIGKRVFVSNLSWDTRWQELKDHFKQVGTVVRADVLTQRDGRSSGSGVIEFESPHEAMKAISVVSNTELDGRMITVREDREEFSK